MIRQDAASFPYDSDSLHITGAWIGRTQNADQGLYENTLIIVEMEFISDRQYSMKILSHIFSYEVKCFGTN